MSISELDDSARSFLMLLYEKTGGDTTATASMYDIGEMAQMDRDTAAKNAELLIGNSLAEIKTLSGGIGITTKTVEEIENAAGDKNSAGNQPVLSDSVIISETDRGAVEQAITEIKFRINDIGLEFDMLAGLITDLKTIDVQLTSPAPKTAIIRECFKSIQKQLSQSSPTDIKQRVAVLLGK
jgi:hypothetical protein